MAYDDTSLEKIRAEETEYLYDLHSILEELAFLISSTAVDFPTVTASRISLADNEGTQFDEVIRITDKYGNELTYLLAISVLRNHSNLVFPTQP